LFAEFRRSRQIQRDESSMLTTIRIKNLALVPDLTLELQPGYNAITGETGAGKSIIIGALNLVLGERADRTLIRAGAESCTVEALFDVSKLRAPLKTFLEENGLEPFEDGQLALKRTFTTAGANRQFINGSPTTLAVLAALGEWLVDIHGPHDHQSLLHATRQLAILDAFGGLQSARDAFAALLQRRAALEAEKSALITDEKTYAQQLDILRFQTCEISTARLQSDEEPRLQAEFQRASNAAKLLELSQTALGLLSDNENSLLTQSGLLGRALQELQRIDPAAANLLAIHEQTAATLRELQNDLSHYAEKVDIDPARLAELETRLDLIHSLKRKYGATLPEIITFGETACEKLRQLEQRDVELTRLNADLKKIETELWRAGRELSVRRRKLIPQLAQAVVKQLKDLGFAQSHFDVAITSLTPDSSAPPGSQTHLDNAPASNGQERGVHAASSFADAQLNSSTIAGNTLKRPEGRAPGAAPGFAPPTRLPASGLDIIEFQFAPNAGEPPRPLRAIASSGELARVMLALKTVLAEVDEIPVLVFDEVDANVGGETASAVGAKMRHIARQRQVLCITHLAPVAAHAAAHYLVTKKLRDGRTVSEITLVDRKERVTELARMLGGQSDAARKHAEALLK
jgi:DNA repair protein RecN (Recombination protein N)